MVGSIDLEKLLGLRGDKVGLQSLVEAVNVFCYKSKYKKVSFTLLVTILGSNIMNKLGLNSQLVIIEISGMKIVELYRNLFRKSLLFGNYYMNNCYIFH